MNYFSGGVVRLFNLYIEAKTFCVLRINALTVFDDIFTKHKFVNTVIMR